MDAKVLADKEANSWYLGHWAAQVPLTHNGHWLHFPS